MAAGSFAILDPTALSTLQVYGNERALCEGSRILPVLNLNFNLNQTYSLDYSNQMRLGRVSRIQTVFIDASNTDAPIQVSSNTGQVVVAKGRTQGFYPFLAQEPFKASIFCSGGGINGVIFLNFAVQPSQWATQ